MATPSPKLDLTAIRSLTFHAPDRERFPALDLAYAALQEGGSAPAILNAANEVAVAAFLEHRIGFLEITEIVGETLTRMSGGSISSIEEVIAVDQEARNTAEDLIANLSK